MAYHDEPGLLLNRLQEEEDARARGPIPPPPHRRFKSGQVWLLCVVYFGFVMGNYDSGSGCLK